MNIKKSTVIIAGTALIISCAGGAGYINNPSHQSESLPTPSQIQTEKYAEPLKIAVMPFANLTSDKNLDWLSFGISETVTTELAKIHNYRLIERMQMDKIIKEWAIQVSDAVDPKTAVEVGKALGVEYVVIGSFQKYQDKLKIDVRRIKVEDGEICETESVIGPENDVFKLQETISKNLREQFDKIR